MWARAVARRALAPASRVVRPTWRRFGDDEKKTQRKMDSSTSVRRSDPVGGILFGRDASLPALVVLCGFFFYLNYQRREEEQEEALELEAQAHNLAKIREARQSRRDEMDLPARLAFKRNQLAYFRGEVDKGDGDARLLARVERLEREVEALARAVDARPVVP